MTDRTQAIEIARALSDPLRMAMLEHLMQGPAAVSELVSLVEASQPNVSNHLNVLRGAGLIRAVKSGRQRIYEIRDAGAAQLIEALFAAAGPSAHAIKPTPALALARTCYDHVAGRLGVALFDRLRHEQAITAPQALRTLRSPGTPIELAPQGEKFFETLGITTSQVVRGRKPYAFGCRDWTEQKPHLGGRLGAALWAMFIERGWLVSRPGERAVVVTAEGSRQFARHFAIDVDALRRG